MPGVTKTAWDQHKVSYKYPPLTEDATADVCVIGAGIYGACIAYSLQKAGDHSQRRGSLSQSALVACGVVVCMAAAVAVQEHESSLVEPKLRLLPW